MKPSNLLGTTPEQVEKLIKAGLNPDTADLHYSNSSPKSLPYTEDDISLRINSFSEATEMYSAAGVEPSVFFVLTPAWSIGALWEILYKSGIKYSPNTMAMDVNRLLTLLVNWVIQAIEQGKILPEFLTSAEASEE